MRRFHILLLLLAVGAVAGTWYWLHHRPRGMVAVQVTRDIWPPAITPARKRLLAQTACGSSPVQVDGKGEITCSVCPAGSDFAPSPGTQPPGDMDSWKVDSVLFGHFTAPDAHEAVLHVNGCESHANSFGGGFLLRQAGTQWQTVRYMHGMTGGGENSCQTLRWGNGRDVLLCQVGDMHQGVASDGVELIGVQESAPAKQPSWPNGTLISVNDDSSNCEDPYPAKNVHVGSIAAVKQLPPASPGGLQDVQVSVKLGMASLPKGSQQCPAVEQKTYTVTFHSGGGRLAAAGGAPALQALVPKYDENLTIAGTVTPMQF